MPWETQKEGKWSSRSWEGMPKMWDLLIFVYNLFWLNEMNRELIVVFIGAIDINNFNLLEHHLCKNLWKPKKNTIKNTLTPDNCWSPSFTVV